MIDWISQHEPVLALVVSTLTLAVWGAYLQLFWRSYRRQLQPNILVARGVGAGAEARCLVSNMSAEAIHIYGVVVVTETPEGRFSCAVADSGRRADGSPSVPSEGPLKPGNFVDIGAFGDLLNAAERRRPDGAAATAVEIWVVADYGTESLSVVAMRRYEIDHRNGRLHLRADEFRTRRVRDRARRREIEQALEEDLQDDHVAAGASG